jgi:hypothetical protein
MADGFVEGDDGDQHGLAASRRPESGPVAKISRLAGIMGTFFKDMLRMTA